MIPTKLAAERAVPLSAARIAEVCCGRVLRQGGPAVRVAIDSRNLTTGDCFVALPGDRFDGHEFVREALLAGAAGAVVSRSVPRAGLPRGSFLVRVPDTHEALLRMAATHRSAHDARVVGITGSCGKTSTKDMLGHVLGTSMPTVQSPKSFNNNVGVPLTLFQITKGTRVAVVEVGSNTPGEVGMLAEAVQPDIAIITGIAESHLEGLGSVAGVAAEKASLTQALPKDGLAILNGDDAHCDEMAARTDARVVKVRVDSEAHLFATDVSFGGLGTTFRLMGEQAVTIPRMGSHNVHNALFTIAAAQALGMCRDEILAALCDLPDTKRRLECKRLGDITVVDDTYNSNPASARAALKALAGMRVPGRRIVLLGGMLELGERSVALHQQLGRQVHEAGVDILVTVGEGGRPVAAGARRAGLSRRAVLEVAGITAAVDELMRLLRPGDWLLCKRICGEVDGEVSGTAQA
ncbi:MAG: UDP-N-acetylmuramoyl-tripeptide--D-alanyl-D-alanine ligase [Planctomycetota bacterium]|jgi:UDP-N-acetylmuramoyl-tripeptide--D-alanyl-D-alanine ligase